MSMYVACNIHNILVPELKEAIADKSFTGKLFKFKHISEDTIAFMLEFFRLPCTFKYNIQTHKSEILLMRD